MNTLARSLTLFLAQHRNPKNGWTRLEKEVRPKGWVFCNQAAKRTIRDCEKTEFSGKSPLSVYGKRE